MDVPRGRTLVVPAVMLGVALLHGVRVATLHQSTWQGAGFGMFATYDFDDTRGVVAVAIVEGREVQMSLDALAPSLHRRARVVPSDDVLRDVAGKLAARAPAGTRRIRVEVRGPRTSDGVVAYEVINAVTVDA